MRSEKLGSNIEFFGVVLQILLSFVSIVIGLYQIWVLHRFLEGFIVIVGGFFFAWLITLLLRGFGRLVENSQQAVKLLQKIAEQQEKE